MAADNSKPVKGKRRPKNKARRGKFPVKRSINLILIDEKKINPFKAALGIVIIIALAFAFGKFLVMDRLNALSDAEQKAARLKEQLEQALADAQTIDVIEDTYAHYTMAGMTQAELGLVDRTRILELVKNILPVPESEYTFDVFCTRLMQLVEAVRADEEQSITVDDFSNGFLMLFQGTLPADITSTSWSVSGNVLSINATSISLQRVNELAQELNTNSIVDSCVILSAAKAGKVNIWEDVTARLTVYLQQPKDTPTEGGTTAQ